MRPFAPSVLFFVGCVVLLFSQFANGEDKPSPDEYVAIYKELADPGSSESKQLREAIAKRRQLAEQYLRETADPRALVNKLTSDAKARKEFEQATYHIMSSFESISRESLARLDHRKPEDQIAALPLIRMLGTLRDGASAERIANFLDTPDPEYPDSLGGASLKDSLDKYPAAAALRQIGSGCVPLLERIVLSEPEDGLRMKLAIHTLMVLKEPRIVEKWIIEEPALRKDDKRRSAIQKMAKELRAAYFPDVKK